MDNYNATIKMIRMKHHITEKSAKKYIEKALNGGYGEYTQKLIEGAIKNNDY